MNSISFTKFCQRAAGSGLILALAASWFARTAAAQPETRQEAAESSAALLDRAAKAGRGVLPLLRDFRIDASMSLNWRAVGPRKPGFETQIQDEVYLADIYFGVHGPLLDGFPFSMEWHMPTGSQGQIRLNQLFFDFDRFDDWKFRFGLFLVPFGRYNELYKPHEFLAVTRPLLYASPDSLDLVVRVNSPRPPLSYGYADLGAQISYYPPSLHPLIPTEATFFVVNGLGEATNRQRTFPNPQNLGITPPPPTGVDIDFSHKNNNLADNNNFKSVGGRLVFGLGDVRLPWPLPEAAADLKGMVLGLSGMGGQYDLEGRLHYQMYGVDASFDYAGFNFSGEYMYSFNDLLAPLEASSATLTSPLYLVRSFEVNHGFFVQASFPLMRRPRVGKRLTGILVFNQMFRRGPKMDLFLNFRDNDTFTVYPSLNAVALEAPRINRRIDKYTAGLNYQLTDHLFVKSEYSYWVMGQATTRSDTSLGLVDIYQTAVSLAMSF